MASDDVERPIEVRVMCGDVLVYQRIVNSSRYQEWPEMATWGEEPTWVDAKLVSVTDDVVVYEQLPGVA